MDIGATAAYIASAAFPLPKLLAGIAAFRARADRGCPAGALFFPKQAPAAAYVYLASRHGPSRWAANQASRLFAIIHIRRRPFCLRGAPGPGHVLAMNADGSPGNDRRHGGEGLQLPPLRAWLAVFAGRDGSPRASISTNGEFAYSAFRGIAIVHG